MNKIIDIHGHYVFGVDDGAKSLEMSLAMIKSASAQGVHHIFCTSHDSAHLFYYQRNFHALQSAVKEHEIDVVIQSGCEIYCEENYIGEIIEKLNDGNLIPMGSSNYVLLEFSPWVTCEELAWCASQVRMETEYEPIIAHMERYLWLQDDPEVLNIVKEVNLLVQINAYSLVEEKRQGTKDFARKLLEEKLVTFIGSDAHRTDHRPVNFDSGIRYIFDTCDEAYAKAVCYENAEKLLCVEHV